MSLENEIKKLVAALDRNTAALESAPSPATTTPETPKPSTAQAEPAAEPTPEPKQETEKKSPAVDKKAVTGIIVDLAKKKGREAAAGLLAEFGATKVPEVKEEEYAAVFAKAEELLAS